MDEILTRDLFGDVTTLPSGRRGRPAHRWSQSNADRVMMGLVMGFSNAEIANGLGITQPTLRKYYFSELKRREMQRSRFELWRAEMLAKEAGAGNVTAMRELDRIVVKRDRHLAEERLRAGSDDAASAEPIGKKEAARRAAEQVAEDDKGHWGNLLDPSAGLH